MSEPAKNRLRLRLPNGAELEAEGPADFIQTERAIFLAGSEPPRSEGDAHITRARAIEPSWNSLIESKASGQIQLRAKLKGDKQPKDACLLLLAAAERVLHASKPTASQIARWLRASGYPVQRVDRAIAEGVSRGEILASGSRRARRYELTGPGRAKAYLLGREMADWIGS